MAQRPVFVPSSRSDTLVEMVPVEFVWSPGMAKTQRQKSIRSLHDTAKRILDIDNVLEISSKSEDELGIALSSFNLLIKTKKNGCEFSVESAYQASKVFRDGGPYVDLLYCGPRDAKRDDRLLKSGPLLRFSFFREDWPLEPTYLFYDWLYINALAKQEELALAVLGYDAFSDIEFNPRRSVNCQAHAAALFLALERRGLIQTALSSSEEYRRIVSEFSQSREEPNQTSLL